MPAEPAAAGLLGAFVYFSGLTLERYVVFAGVAFVVLWWLARKTTTASTFCSGIA